MDRDVVRWAFRLLIGREPRDDNETDFHLPHGSIDALRAAFLNTPEFEALHRQHRGENPGDRRYAAPLFLLQPPDAPAIPWRFSAPELAAPVSQLCTASQFEEPAFAAWCERLDIIPAAHRKIWEFCFVAAAMEATGVLRPGKRALGFGVGTEPLPALLASRGATVVATDAPIDLVADQGWASTGQHATGLQVLDRPRILPFDVLRKMVSFEAVDMNAIPETLRDFDVCWSSCALEHLGSIEHGLRFIEESLRSLRPGGYAIHTTEFNLSSNEKTFEVPGLSLFRKRDIEALATRLLAAGHQLLPLNFHPGDREVDAHIDLPPYAMPHLKLEVAGFVTTSIGLIIRKAG
jgi:SAM-dependent methyltransferase